ncbi:hypothetical protein AAC387_Pa07g1852 [Persea americana]
MEEHKWRYLNDILDRGQDDLLERCLPAIRKLEKKARTCYSEKVDLHSNPFVEMLVLDGFFIIEFFRRSLNPKYRDDPIVKLGWLKSTIRMDLLLLENQIPFFVLESLCKEMGILEFETFLMKQVLPFFVPTNENAPNSTQEVEKENAPTVDTPNVTKKEEKENAPTVDTPNVTKKEEKENAPTVDTPNVTKKEEKENATKFQHLLHFVHGFHLPKLVDEKPTRRKLQIIPNASRLQEAGIKFAMGPGSDIKFEKGVIKIPPLKVMDATKSVLLNLVAFEQCYRHCNSHFAGYTYFMDCLVDNAKDVQILCENGIINRWLSSDQEVAALFNKMGREIIVYDHDSNLLNVCEEINRYYGASWHAWRTSLKRNYFNNPWAIISVAAAVILLLFTFSQTFFSAFPKFAAGN